MSSGNLRVCILCRLCWSVHTLKKDDKFSLTTCGSNHILEQQHVMGRIESQSGDSIFIVNIRYEINEDGTLCLLCFATAPML